MIHIPKSSIIPGQHPQPDSRVLADVLAAGPPVPALNDEPWQQLYNRLAPAVADACRKYKAESARVEHADGVADTLASELEAWLMERLSELCHFETVTGYRCVCGWTSRREPDAVTTDGHGRSGPTDYHMRCAPETDWVCPDCGGSDIDEVDLCDGCDGVADEQHVCGLEAA